MPDRATPEGTRRYAGRRAEAAEGHFRDAAVPGDGPLRISSLGIGTYTGPETDAGDRDYRAAVAAAVRLGVNLVDCAINYRHMRSERAVGAALADLFAAGDASRDEVVVMTKGGYLPFDGAVPPDPAGWLRRTWIDAGPAPAAEVVGGVHCIAPAFLRDQLSRSLRNLGLAAVDVYFLHNPEQQLEEASAAAFETRTRAAFEALEDEADRGRIGVYGVATWNGFRVPPEDRGHLSLERLLGIAREAGGEAHRFRAVQLPYNLGMTEALAAPTQPLRGHRVPFLEAAAEFGLTVVTSVPLLQTKLLLHIPESFAERMPGLRTPAQRALQFVRSTPGVLAPLAGMRRRDHVEENAELRRHPPLGGQEFYRLFTR